MGHGLIKSNIGKSSQGDERSTPPLGHPGCNAFILSRISTVVCLAYNFPDPILLELGQKSSLQDFFCDTETKQNGDNVIFAVRKCTLCIAQDNME